MRAIIFYESCSFHNKILLLQREMKISLLMKINKSEENVTSKSTLKRLPLYHSYLKCLVEEGKTHISSTTISQHLRFSSIQVRKDLAAVSSVSGKPRVGFDIAILLKDIAAFLRYNNTDDAVLVGVGQLGRTLLSYDGFSNYGLNIAAGFDINPDLAGLKINGKNIFSIDKLNDFIKRMNIKIAIITVPKEAAQGVCDLLISAGIRGIWNFAPTHLEIPASVIIKNENLASSFAYLSNKLASFLNQ